MKKQNTLQLAQKFVKQITKAYPQFDVKIVSEFPIGCLEAGLHKLVVRIPNHHANITYEIWVWTPSKTVQYHALILVENEEEAEELYTESHTNIKAVIEDGLEMIHEWIEKQIDYHQNKIEEYTSLGTQVSRK